MDRDNLLDLLVKQDNRAYQYLYRYYYVALRSVAVFYVKDQDVAEDLVQDVFISMLESNYKFKVMDELKYFLYSSLKNKCISHFRKQRVRNKYCKEILYLQSEVEHFWDKVLEEDVYARLMAAIETLPHQCKMVMMLSLKGMKGPEIAQKLQISLETVKDHKSNAKKKLASRLKGGELYFLIVFLCS